MALKLYYHPLASFCWKALDRALRERYAFRTIVVDLGNDECRARPFPRSGRSASSR